MQVVVTGGAGFIGSHLVDALLERTGDSVLVFDNLRRGRMSHLSGHCGNPRFRFVSGDVRDPALLLEVLRGAELVYHLAGQANVMGAISEPRYTFESNVIGTFNVLDAAFNGGARRVVFASSREAYGESGAVPVVEDAALAAKNTYGASKVAAEAYCRTYANVFGLDTVVLRFANVYGPRDSDRLIPKWIDDAVHGRPLACMEAGKLSISSGSAWPWRRCCAQRRPIHRNSRSTLVRNWNADRRIGRADTRRNRLRRSRMLVTPERGAEVRRSRR